MLHRWWASNCAVALRMAWRLYQLMWACTTTYGGRTTAGAVMLPVVVSTGDKNQAGRPPLLVTGWASLPTSYDASLVQSLC